MPDKMITKLMQVDQTDFAGNVTTFSDEAVAAIIGQKAPIVAEGGVDVPLMEATFTDAWVEDGWVVVEITTDVVSGD